MGGGVPCIGGRSATVSTSEERSKGFIPALVSFLSPRALLQLPLPRLLRPPAPAAAAAAAPASSASHAQGWTRKCSTCGRASSGLRPLSSAGGGMPRPGGARALSEALLPLRPLLALLVAAASEWPSSPPVVVLPVAAKASGSAAPARRWTCPARNFTCSVCVQTNFSSSVMRCRDCANSSRAAADSIALAAPRVAAAVRPGAASCRSSSARRPSSAACAPFNASSSAAWPR
mmetsp:Transcript_136471/g.380402  ORF Transcript_136471/g.380402 Transcript_136471/m.380402 type:complete len:232 (-) Transcript_136471:339-1034(-)